MKVNRSFHDDLLSAIGKQKESQLKAFKDEAKYKRDSTFVTNDYVNKLNLKPKTNSFKYGGLKPNESVVNKYDDGGLFDPSKITKNFDFTKKKGKITAIF